MTFDEFSTLLAHAKPGAIAHAHGAYETTTATGRRQKTQTVGISFYAGGKVYEYKGSYTSILSRFGAGPTWYAVPSGEQTCWRGPFWTQGEAQAACENALAEQAADKGLWTPDPETQAAYKAQTWAVRHVVHQ